MNFESRFDPINHWISIKLKTNWRAPPTPSATDTLHPPDGRVTLARPLLSDLNWIKFENLTEKCQNNFHRISIECGALESADPRYLIAAHNGPLLVFLMWRNFWRTMSWRRGASDPLPASKLILSQGSKTPLIAIYTFRRRRRCRRHSRALL